MERYMVLNGFDHYAISNYGRVKNIKTGRMIKQFVSPTGYCVVTICQNNVKKTLRVHRLVAIHFLDNPQNLPQVNHIDGNKLNNHVNNLEWVTAKENDAHARNMKLKDENKPIKAIDLETNETIAFSSISEAGAVLGINTGTICKVLKGKRQKTHGFSFQYIAKI